jgi:hypothetical protein
MIDEQDRHTITLKLTPVIRDGEHYLREETTGDMGKHLEWGPVPKDMMPLLIEERQVYWRTMVRKLTERMLERVSEINYSFGVVGDTAAPNPRPHPDGGPAARAGSHEGAEPPGLDPYRRHEI